MNQFVYTLVLINQLLSVPKFDPNLNWRVLRSDHFEVYFSNHKDSLEQRTIAQEVLWYCESFHKQLTSFFNYAPRKKTKVIISSFSDTPGGWATPFPHNTIFINLTFPQRLKVNYRHWLNHLICHEYTHILTTDMTRGLSNISRKVLGKVIAPNTLFPLFLTEGYAVYSETKFSKLGRLNSSYYKMLMRTHIVENKFFPFDQWVSYEITKFPGAELPYFYGSIFLNYLVYKYSEKSIIEFLHNQSTFPLFFNCRAKKIWRKNFYALYKEFKNEMTNNYETQSQEIKAKRLTRAQKITNLGHYLTFPIFSKDQTKIYFIFESYEDHKGLWEYDLKTGHKKLLLQKNITSSIRLSPDGTKLLFSIQDYYRNFYYYNDLYLYDLKSKKLQRLTSGQGASDPDFSPDGKKIVFIKNELEGRKLMILNLVTNEQMELFIDQGLQYHQPRFAPDGSKLALSVWKPGGEQDLYIYDLNTGWLFPVTQDQALNIDPCWSNDGNYLFYTSDQDGVFNIYAYGIKENQYYQVTNVLTGAFAPALSEDRKELLFTQYSHKGYDIYLLKVNFDSFELITPQTLLEDRKEEIRLSTDTIYAYETPYQPLASLFPQFWVPLITYRSEDRWTYGFFTYNNDALFKHQYWLYGLYNPKNRRPTMYLEYTLNTFFPTISFLVNYEPTKIRAQALNYFSWLKNDYQRYFYFGYQYQRDSKITSGLLLGYNFTNTKHPPRTIGPQGGRKLKLEFSLQDKRLKSTDNKMNILGTHTEFLKLFLKHHLLITQLNFGFSVNKGSFCWETQDPIKIVGNKDILNGRYVLKFHTEYRIPICWIERGCGITPLFLKNIWGKVFFETGSGIESLKEIMKPPVQLKGLGVEINLHTLVFYEVPINFSGGVSTDLKEKRITEYYFKIKPTGLLSKNTQ
jgi:Tol biopolymer transport system component